MYLLRVSMKTVALLEVHIQLHGTAVCRQSVSLSSSDKTGKPSMGDHADSQPCGRPHCLPCIPCRWQISRRGPCSSCDRGLILTSSAMNGQTNPTKALEITRWLWSGGAPDLALIHYEGAGVSETSDAKDLGAVCMKALQVYRDAILFLWEAGIEGRLAAKQSHVRRTIYFLVADGSLHLSSAFPITLPPFLLQLHFHVLLPFYNFIFILFPLSFPFITLIFDYFFISTHLLLVFSFSFLRSSTHLYAASPHSLLLLLPFVLHFFLFFSEIFRFHFSFPYFLPLQWPHYCCWNNP